MKKIKLIAILSVLCMLIVFLIAVALNMTKFLVSHGIHKVNGNMTIIREQDDLKKYLANMPLADIVTDNGTYTVYVKDAESDIVLRQNDLLNRFEITGEDILSVADIRFDKDRLKSLLESMLSRIVREYEVNEEYSLVYEGNAITVSPLKEYPGLDIDALIDAIDKDFLLINEKVTERVDDFIYYIPYNKEEYDELVAYLNKFDTMSIKYDKGIELPIKNLESFAIANDGKHIVFNTESEDFLTRADTFVSSLRKTYDTNQESVVKKKINGKKYTLTNHGVGEEINLEKEVKAIVDLFTNWELINPEELRHPICNVYGKTDDIGKNYILIDKGTQTLTCYRDGKETYTCPVVTGLPTADRDTPTGAFYILERKRSYTMESGTYVDYWLRITWDGHGLHDANWQAKFGGDWYKKHGSHGCVNISPEDMPNIYENWYCYDVVVII